MKRAALCLLLVCLTSCAEAPPSVLTGTWSRSVEDPLGMFLELKSDHTFSLGGIQNGERFPGLSGTWESKGDRLLLRVKTSESCKVKEGEEIAYQFQLISDHQLQLGLPDFDDKLLLERTP